MKKISIILPVFNEEENLASTLDHSFQLITKYKSIQFEIIAINDGSTDKSLEILRKYKIKIINHTQKQGYGASLKDGIKNSKYDNLIILDADGSYPPFELYRILQYRGPAPLRIGTRKNYYSLIRHVVNKMLAFLASLLFRRWISDLNSGMRLFRKPLIQQLNYNSWPNGFSFTTTMTLSTVIRNIPIKEIPIRSEPRKGSSKAINIRLGLNILRIILKFFRLKYKI